MGLAIITGASRGIGSEIAKRLAKDKFDVVINCKSNIDKANMVAEECKVFGVKAMVLPWDVSVMDECRAALEKIKSDMGTPDVLVNNAGITRDGLFMRMTESDFDDVISSNLKSVFNMSSVCGNLMIRAKKGKIINISSIVGVAGNAGQANYCAAKAGIIGFTKSLAKELGSRNICVNAIAPGFIETEMTSVLADDLKAKCRDATSLKRLGKPSEIASLVSFLASEDSSYINGQVIIADGGLSI